MIGVSARNVIQPLHDVTIPATFVARLKLSGLGDESPLDMVRIPDRNEPELAPRE
jgi:hypothetical protein